MIINFRAQEDKHIKLLEKALNWFNEINPVFMVLTIGGDVLKIQRSITILSPFISDILDSLPITNDVPNIIIPDCSAASFRHLVDLLTTGSTKACEDVQSVIEVAKVFKIDIKHLVADKPIEVDKELEDGEIVDCNEELPLLETNTKMTGTNSGIKVAGFSRAFISVPNLMNNNPSFQCPECDKCFSKKLGFISHMKRTTKHIKNKPNSQGEANPSLKPAIAKTVSFPSSSSSISTINLPGQDSSTTATPFNIQSCGRMFTNGGFSLPAGLAVNTEGDILVVDSGNRRVQVFDKERRPKFFFGIGSGKVTQDKIAVSPNLGYIVLLELLPTSQLKVFSESGELLDVFGKKHLESPRALTIDSQERILVVDGKSLSILIFSRFGDLLDRISCVGLCSPSSVTVSGQEEILISDYLTHYVMVYDHSGCVRRRLGGPGVCSRPFSVCLTRSGLVIVADRQAKLVKFTVFSQAGQLLGSMRSDMEEQIATDMALASDGCLVVSGKDNHLYSFNFGVASL